MASRRKKATRKKSSGTPAWMWLLTGVLVGLGMAYYLFSKGFIPKAESPAQTSERVETTTGEELAPAQDSARREDKSQYDFFTVLPEMEVVVPEQELQRQRQAQQAAERQSQQQGATPSQPDNRSAGGQRYVLQAGSFQQNADAEKRRASLALLGLNTQVQTVTVNGATWHRVLVGPVNGAARADEVRRQLSANGIDSMVTKSP